MKSYHISRHTKSHGNVLLFGPLYVLLSRTDARRVKRNANNSVQREMVKSSKSRSHNSAVIKNSVFEEAKGPWLVKLL